MSISVDRYEWDGEPFRGRQHLVNHIDMLFGLGTEEWSAGRDRRIAVNVRSRYGDMRISPMWLYGEETLRRGRKWVQYQSLFAVRWEQLYPKHGDEYFSPDDLGEDDDLLALLNECLDIWTDEDDFCGGDYDRFCEETSFVVLLGAWDPVRADRIVVRRRPSADYDNLPVPVNGRRVMATRHEGRVEWRAFADRICQSEHVKGVLGERQGGVCAICGLELGKRVVVHHVDYDHECDLTHLGQGWTRPGTRVQPDCERCHKEHPELFDDCLSRLRAVHSECNYLIEATL